MSSVKVKHIKGVDRLSGDNSSCKSVCRVSTKFFLKKKKKEFCHALHMKKPLRKRGFARLNFRGFVRKVVMNSVRCELSTASRGDVCGYSEGGVVSV
jgi:hypothetical protein